MNRPWMPLYIGDYLTSTQHLMATESGAYLHLMMHYWRCGPLPDNDGDLCRIAKVWPPHWTRIRAKIEPFFDLTKRPGLWSHVEVDAQISKMVELSNKRKASALQMHKNQHANAEQLHTYSHLDSESKKVSKIDSKKESKKQTAAKGERIPPGWRPSAESIAAAKAMGFSDSEIALTTAEFLDYWSTLQGPKALNSNWDYTWRNRFRFFLRNPQFRRPQSKSGNGANPAWVSPDKKGIYGVDWW